MDWPEGIDPSFTYSLGSDDEARCDEYRLASWVPTPNECPISWRLTLPTVARVSFDDPRLPPFNGGGRLILLTVGSEFRCGSGLVAHVEDVGPGALWFDFVEHHVLGARPREVRVVIHVQCDGASGTLMVDYEVNEGDYDISGSLTFPFGA